MSNGEHLSTLKSARISSSKLEQDYPVTLRGLYDLVDDAQETQATMQMNADGEKAAVYDGGGMRRDKKLATTFGVHFQLKFAEKLQAGKKEVQLTHESVAVDVPAAVVNEILRSTKADMHTLIPELNAELTDEMRNLVSIKQVNAEMKKEVIGTVMDWLANKVQSVLQKQDFSTAVSREEKRKILSSYFVDTFDIKELKKLVAQGVVPILGFSREQIAHVLQKDRSEGQTLSARSSLGEWKPHFERHLQTLSASEEVDENVMRFAELMCQRKKYQAHLLEKGFIDQNGNKNMNKFARAYEKYIQSGKTLEELEAKVAAEQE